MKNKILFFIFSGLRIFVFLIALILFLVNINKNFLNFIFTIIIVILLLDEVFKFKELYENKQRIKIDSDLGAVYVTDNLILQLINKVINEIELIKTEKIEVNIRGNKIFVGIILNIKPGTNFYGIAHNIELAVKRELNEILGFDNKIIFEFNIDRIIQ
ncbi:MAG TPA: hypothetical protein PLD27_05880 [bacterium]|nr:hypothetical protein [bacterium]HOL47176.1 hypothetical protein [bacterium]HPQ17669.1 hypothetical protein [bacterium]